MPLPVPNEMLITILATVKSISVSRPTPSLWKCPITSGSRIITLGKGECYGLVPCSGQSGDPPCANPGAPPGNAALDATSKVRGFTYDGYYSDSWNDFLINNIAGLADLGDGKVYKFWAMAINYQVSQFGDDLTLSGCQQLLDSGKRYCERTYWLVDL